MRRWLLVVMLLFPLLPQAISQARSSFSWCGYALIEGIPGIETYLPMVSLITPDETSTSNPYTLFQDRISLDGSKAIIEACWKVYPSIDVITNLLKLGGLDATLITGLMTYSIFAPGASDADSAASVRDYLSQHLVEWEPLDDLP